jgi:hypothetical protein
LTSFNITTLEKVLWAGLLHEEPTLTVALVAKRLERYADEHGSLVELFTSAIRSLNESGLFESKGIEDESGNSKPEAVTT